MHSEEKKGTGKVKALDGQMYDLFITMGDRPEDIAYGGTYLREHYEPGELPLGIANQYVKFDIQTGWAFNRVKQLAEIGLFNWRTTGVRKPAMLSLLVSDHAEYFARTTHDRIQRQITANAKAKQPPTVTLTPEFINVLDACESKHAAYALLMNKFTEGNMLDDLSTYWNSYKAQTRKILK